MALLAGYNISSGTSSTARANPFVGRHSVRSEAPIPSSERDLPSTQAEPWLNVIAQGSPLEGLAFDLSGNLILCDVGGDRILRVTQDRTLSVVLHQQGLGPGGLAVDREGRLYVAGAKPGRAGVVGVLEGFSNLLLPVLENTLGFVPNDLALDGEDGFYFTDFKGSTFEAIGGVYHVASKTRTITPISTQMALPNGIALAPDGRTLWVAEMGRNRLVRIRLANSTTVQPLGIDVIYNFIGPRPDTVRTDAAGNVLVALNGQGRLLVFSPGGIPIGQVLLPRRDEGRNLRATSMAISPSSDAVFIVSSDGDRGGGGSIFRAPPLP